jgi:O-antigen ligase
LLSTLKRRLAGHRLATQLGAAGLVAFAFGGCAGTALENLGLLMLVVAFALKRPLAWRQLLRHPMTWLLLLFLAYLALRTIGAMREFPESASEQAAAAWSWAGLWLFIFVARWLDVSRSPIVLGVALAGFFVGILYHQSWPDLALALGGVRSGFGYGIPQAGLLSAVVVVGLAAFAPRWWAGARNLGRAPGWIALWAAALTVAIGVLLITQSRISWLAAAAVGPPVAWLAIRHMPARPRGHTLLAIVSIGGLVLLLLLANRGVINERLVQSAESVEAIRERTVAGGVARDPFAIRAELVRHGIARWLERPLFGWGPGTQVAPSAESLPVQMKHLHNTYLELLARLGLVGASFFAVGLWIVARAAWKAYQEDRLALDHFAFLVGAFSVLAIWSAANFRFTSEVRFLIVLLSAVAYSAAFRHPLPRPISAAAPNGAGDEPAPLARGGEANQRSRPSASR